MYVNQAWAFPRVPPMPPDSGQQNPIHVLWNGRSVSCLCHPQLGFKPHERKSIGALQKSIETRTKTQTFPTRKSGIPKCKSNSLSRKAEDSTPIFMEEVDPICHLPERPRLRSKSKFFPVNIASREAGYLRISHSKHKQRNDGKSVKESYRDDCVACGNCEFPSCETAFSRRSRCSI